ncbi:MAG: phosphonoacetaldehyde reductase [Lachnospiraceae bacterium]|nr:phosphonoacetaldehyde reductase [Lachnospiraceae bacterium]
MKQEIISANGAYSRLDVWFRKKKCIMLVCGKSIEKQNIFAYIQQLPDRFGIRIVRFSDFEPNPRYESVVNGVRIFRRESCEAIVAIGGGSAMDVAKCIKLYSTLQGDGKNGEWLTQVVVPNHIPFLAMPTTAGTGSEATRFSVIYYENKKQSVTDDSCLPETVLMDSNVLRTLPDYQKKSTMMDALCHAIESYWSVNSTKESRAYSKDAIQTIMKQMNAYLANTDEGNAAMLMAAHYAGKAINITQTTAGHAMCYKITSMFGCAHGHATALCNKVLYPWMVENVDRCTDPRGIAYLKNILNEIADALGCRDARSGGEKLAKTVDALGFEVPIASTEQYEELKSSVNPVRLKNHPILLDEETIDKLYHMILR